MTFGHLYLDELLVLDCIMGLDCKYHSCADQLVANNLIYYSTRETTTTSTREIL